MNARFKIQDAFCICILVPIPRYGVYELLGAAGNMGGSDNDNKSITLVGSDDSSCGNEGSRRRFHDSGIPRSVSTTAKFSQSTNSWST